MPRQLRCELPNGLYQVSNRGLERQSIVIDDVDRESWLRLLGRVVQRYDWAMFAYVLLDNHFQLCFRIREANLSAGMHDFESSYVARFNKRHRRVGSLFPGRFKSELVANESRTRELTRQLHLAPVRVCPSTDPQTYPWSSYRFYLDPRGAPPWLDWKTVLVEVGGTEAAARQAYLRFIDTGILPMPPSPPDQPLDGQSLGNHELDAQGDAVATEDGAGGCAVPFTASRRLTLEDIVRVVETVFQASPEQIRRRGRQLNLPREATILLARELTGETITSLGRFFGVGGSAISETTRRASQRAEQDEPFRELLDQTRRRLEW